MQVQLDIPSDVAEEAEVWILLTRHVRSHRSKNEYIALTAQAGSDSSAAVGGNILSTKVRVTHAPS